MKKLEKRRLLGIISEETKKKYNINNNIAELLGTRGIFKDEDVAPFLSDSFTPNIFNIKNMNKVLDRIMLAVIMNQKICIWGDYDADGLGASSTLYLGLKELTNNVFVYIPHRHKEGYGLNQYGLDILIKEKVDLMITVDCGISEIENVKYAKQYMDVIVTDHHEPKEELPDCLIMDLKQPQETYEFKELAGAGLAFYIVVGLLGIDKAMKFIDIPALSTIADVVPLNSDNRSLVKQGLLKMNSKPVIGIQALLNAGDISSKVKAETIAFGLAPMINSKGRLGSAKETVSLLISKNPEFAKNLASEFKKTNDDRKTVERQIYKEAIEMIEGQKLYNNKIIVVVGQNWNKGVVGIVASKIKEKYYRPVLICSETIDTDNNSVISGSGRSIDGLNIHELMSKIDDVFITWGGHAAACGFSLSGDRFFEMKSRIEDEANKLDNNLFVNKVLYDMILEPEDITLDFVKELDIIEPCGQGNPKPRFLIQKMLIKTFKEIGSEKNHLSIILGKGKTELNAIWFNHTMDDLKAMENIDIVFELQINEFANRISIQLLIQDIFFYEENIKKSKKSDSTIFMYDIYKDMEFPERLQNAKIKQFNKCNLYNLVDVANYKPIRYEDKRNPQIASQAEINREIFIVGTITNIMEMKQGKGLIITFEDEIGQSFSGLLFGQTFLRKIFEQKKTIKKKQLISGKTISFNQGPTISIKTIEDDSPEKHRIYPIYKKVTKMSQDYLKTVREIAINDFDDVDYLTKEIIDEFNILTKKESFQKIHFPKNNNDIKMGYERVIFDELFSLSYRIESNKKTEFKENNIKFTKYEEMKRMINGLPYTLTNGQKQAIKDILNGTLNGERLNALIQGDVGCGKTIVALSIMIAANENDYQSCMMAPTEILAKQHYKDMINLVPKEQVGYLASKTKAAEKRNILSGLKDGTIRYLIGTQSVLNKNVEFKKLGLAIIDEQHKFGVVQRSKLLQADSRPHLITMSATPIPRTVAQALFGDNLILCSIKEKPSNRKEIISSMTNDLNLIYNKLEEEITKGHQAYVVCPLLSESEQETMKDIQSVEQEEKALKKHFANKNINIGIIHGKLKKDESEKIIKDFIDNNIRILISTTIIEVGINVPNATIMVLRNAERFGVSQSHQLRGRVGRGDHQSYFIMNANDDDQKAKIVTSESDGFEIAKKDMRIRGFGEILGENQKGKGDNILLALQNKELYDRISIKVREILSDKKQKEFFDEYFNTKEDTAA